MVKIEFILQKEPLWRVHATFTSLGCFIPKVYCDGEASVAVHPEAVAVTSLCAEVACLH